MIWLNKLEKKRNNVYFGNDGSTIMEKIQNNNANTNIYNNSNIINNIDINKSYPRMIPIDKYIKLLKIINEANTKLKKLMI